MKKIFSMAFALMLLVFLTPAQATGFSVDYGNSKVFNKGEIDKCIAVIEKNLNEWGCTLKSVRYVGDEISNSEENIKYMNDLAEGQKFKKKFTKCMVFKTDYQSPPDPHDGKPTAWNYDKEYKDYEWYFGFYEVDGEWKLLTNGY